MLLSNYIYAEGEFFSFIIFLGVLYWFYNLVSGDSSSSGSFSGGSSSFDFSGDRFKSTIKETTKKKERMMDIEIKGKINGNSSKMDPFVTSLALKTYLFDNESDEPFYSLNEAYKDPSESFMSEIGLGQITSDQYLNFSSWTNVASFPKKDIVHPRKGSRLIQAKSFLVNTNKNPIIIAGQPFNNFGIIDTISSTLKMNFDTPGYQDEIDNNEEILCSIVDLAVNVAKSDEDFDKKEGKIIKDWMIRIHKDSLEENKNETKKILNDQFKRSYNGKNTLEKSLNTFNEVAGITQKYNAIDLCVKVLTADGKEDKEETEMIERIVKKLGLDPKEYLRRKEKIVLKSDVSVSGGCTEASLGISPSWTKLKKLKFVKSEFIKWNGRLNTLKEGVQRESAQNKLNCLAELKLKYEKK